MKDKTQLLKRLVVIVAVTVIPLMPLTDSEAETYWEESFEPSANLTNWDTAGTRGNPTITSAQRFDGTQSLLAHYTGQSSGGWMDRYNTSTDDLWTRFYYRTTSFTYDSVGTKHFNLGDAVNYPNFWLMHQGGNRQFFLQAQVPAEACAYQGSPAGNGVPYDYCVYNVNGASVPINDNQWYCVETHIKMNTPGVADGIVELWIDGVQTINYTKRLFRGGQVSGTNGNSSQAAFSFLRLYVQHGVGDMFYDGLAVGNTRIPCVASQAVGVPVAPTMNQLK
jgi:hypothetical protein